MSNLFIYHICTEASWNEQTDASAYIHASLKEENFIHCSEAHQVEGVLNRYFSGQNELCMLTIDTSKLKSPLQYDLAPNGEYFPHIYGSINLSAIIDVKKI